MDYCSEVARHFAAPRHAGPLAAGPGMAVQGEGGSVEQGALVRFQLRVDAGRVVALAWQAWGCPHTIAACSLAAEMLDGRSRAELEAFDPLALRAPLSVPAGKTGRLLFIQDALRKCLAAWDNGGQRTPLQEE
jgi:NifU-like protein involved in Fe-S cluster formation